MSYAGVALIAAGAGVAGFVLRTVLRFRSRAAAAPGVKAYGQHRVTIHDAETGGDYDFFENESAGENRRKPASLGEVVAVGGGAEGVSIWLDDGDAPGGSATLESVECGHTYFVTREEFVGKGRDRTCGGPAEIAARYETVKAEVVAAAVRVAARCQPRCRASIDFQSAFRSCWYNAGPDEWVLQVRYQIRVSCLTP